MPTKTNRAAYGPYPSDKAWVDQKTPTPSVYRRGTGFRVVWRPSGEKRRTKAFDTYEEARAFKLGLPRRKGASRRPSYLLSDPCAYCGGQAEAFDHIEPSINGGDDDWTNLTASCVRCNSAKRERPLLTFLLARLGALPEADERDFDLFALLGH